MSRFVAPPGLGFGGAPLGNLFAAIPEAEAAATLETAWNLGQRYFDTAPLYGLGLSEHRFGAMLRARPRDEFVLSTKVGRLLLADRAAPSAQHGFVDGLPFRVAFDYSAAAVRRSIEDSYQRLGLSRIDIVFIHDIDEYTHGAAWRARHAEAMAGAAPALAALRESGVISGFGLGVNQVEPCLMALERSDPDVLLLAGRYTLLDTAALDTLFPACAARGVSVVIGGPYNSGLLAGGATFNYAAAPAEMVARVRRIAAVCARFAVSIKAAALQFCAAHPVVTSVIPGARNPAELQENAALFRAAIPAAFWAELKREGLLAAQAPTPDEPRPEASRRGPPLIG